jgi:hypothetical protein
VAQGGGPEFKPHYGRKNAGRDQEDSNLKSTQANRSGYQFQKIPPHGFLISHINMIAE